MDRALEGRLQKIEARLELLELLEGVSAPQKNPSVVVFPKLLKASGNLKIRVPHKTREDLPPLEQFDFDHYQNV